MFSPRDVYLEDYSSLDAGLFITTSVFSIKLRLKQTEKFIQRSVPHVSCSTCFYLMYASNSLEQCNILLLCACSYHIIKPKVHHYKHMHITGVGLSCSLGYM